MMGNGNYRDYREYIGLCVVVLLYRDNGKEHRNYNWAEDLGFHSNIKECRIYGLL